MKLTLNYSNETLDKELRDLDIDMTLEIPETTLKEGPQDVLNNIKVIMLDRFKLLNEEYPELWDQALVDLTCGKIILRDEQGKEVLILFTRPEKTFESSQLDYVEIITGIESSIAECKLSELIKIKQRLVTLAEAVTQQCIAEKRTLIEKLEEGVEALTMFSSDAREKLSNDLLDEELDLLVEISDSVATLSEKIINQE